MNNETKLYRFAQSFLLALRLLQLILGDCSVAHDPCSKIEPVAAVQYKHQDNWYPAKWRLMTSLKKNKTSKTRQQQQHVSISNRKEPNLLPFREDAACVLRARARVCVCGRGGAVLPCVTIRLRNGTPHQNDLSRAYGMYSVCGKCGK